MLNRDIPKDEGKGRNVRERKNNLFFNVKKSLTLSGD